MNLRDLLAGIIEIMDLPNLPLTGLALDSREVRAGNAFIALAGSQQHGLDHAAQAISQGAAVIIFDPAAGGGLMAEAISAVPTIAVADLGQHLGTIAARFYAQPSQAMAVIGITGTNGKTSCSQFLAQVLADCGIIGTLGWGSWGNLQKTLNTTPDALSVQKMLHGLQADGNSAVAMEVSSHGLAQGRVNGVHFKGAVFTNISRDHLDYHGTMEAYLAAKLSLLDKPGVEFVVVNLDDDAAGQVIAAAPKAAKLWGVSCKGKQLENGESLTADAISHTAHGLEFQVHWRDGCQTVAVPLYGDFNVENVMLVLAVMLALELEFTEAVERLKQLKPVAGRMERFGGESLPLVFVDYAHTPDALDKVLSSLRQHCKNKIWVVFGCGGNRDTGKRPMMRAAAEHWADRVIITDDNPRFESNEAIVQEILAGGAASQTEVIHDRKQAIEAAISGASSGDCVLIAGKGHEDYQEIAGVRLPFSDREVVLDLLKG